jgi:dipeptidyl aminopeptidase/acylaminoacyl peptidase
MLEYYQGIKGLHAAGVYYQEAIMSKLTINDLYNYKFLSRPRFSPDGEYLGFVVQTPDKDSNGYKGDIWVCEGKNIRRMTSAGDAKQFFWEDGETIVFPADRDAKASESKKAGEKLTIFQRISVFGGEAEEFFRIPLAVSEILPMGDGIYAVVAGWQPGDPDFGRCSKEELDAFKAQKKENADYEVLEEIPFWADGGTFLAKGRKRLYIFNRETGSLKAITDETTNVGSLDLDGNTLYFSARSFEGRMDMPSGIYSWSEKAGLKCLLHQEDYIVDRVFADNGKIVFFGMDWTNIFDKELISALYSLKDGKAVKLTDGEWSPGSAPGSDSKLGGGRTVLKEGGNIYYTHAFHTGTRLVKCDFDGNETVLIDSPDAIGAFDIQGDKLIFIGASDASADELCFGLAGEKISSFNDWMLEKSVVKPEPLVYDFDGVVIEGFCMKPVGYEPGKKYPGILQIHGGPRGAYGGALYHEYQCMANDGYFVFYCNPRGGDGRGAEFADLRGKYGTIDYQDIMNFTDAVLKDYPDIDRSRLGVTGGSYGGYMTNWIIGHTDLFHAAAAQRSISNWISKFLCTDNGYLYNAELLQGNPWDDPEKLWWHSPLKYAANAKTPTLFIQSDQDYRCWMAECIQMFSTLKLHGVDARICLFHGENHNLSREGKPKNRVRRINEITAWMDKYLK